MVHPSDQSLKNTAHLKIKNSISLRYNYKKKLNILKFAKFSLKYRFRFRFGFCDLSFKWLV